MVKNLPTVERSTKIRFGKNCTDDQAENTIVFNASDEQLEIPFGDSVYMTPLRLRTDLSDRKITVLAYNQITKEVMDSGAIAEDILNFTLEAAVINGNVTANTVSFNNAITSVTTLSNVGVANGSPIHTLDVGSTFNVDTEGSNLLTVLGNTYVQDNLVVDGNMTVNGSLTTVATVNTVVKDPIIELGKENVSSDLGIIMHRPNANVAMGFREGPDELVFAYTDSSSYGSTVFPKTSESLDVRVYGRVLTESNVGILTATPTHSLDIGSNLFVDEFGSNVLYVTGNTHTTDILSIGNKVGIKETDPDAELHVEGNVYVSSNLTVDENTFHVDATTHAVGIETKNPDANLHVVGNVYVSEDVTVATDTFHVDAEDKSVGVGTVTPDANLHVVGNVYVNSNLTVDDNTLHVDVTTHSVGIETKEPDANLHVVGNVYVSSNLTVDEDTFHVDATAHAVGIETKNPDANLHVVGNVYTSGDLTVDENTFHVDAVNHAVGIETKSPDANLHVVGNVYVSDDLTVATDTLHVEADTERVGVGTVTPDAKLHVVGNVYVATEFTVDDDTFHVDAVNHSVGIETKSPDANLHVVGNTYVSGDLTVDENTFHVDAVNHAIGIETKNPDANLHVVGNVYVSDDLTVATDALHVEASTQSVGLGTKVPDAKLHAVGNVYVSSNLTVDENTFHVDATAHAVGIETKEPDANLHVVGNVYVSDDLTVATDALHVEASTQSVGIKTKSPDAELHVVGNVYVSSNLTVDEDTFHVDAVNHAVGIETKNPDANLHVVGNVYTSGDLTVDENTFHVDVEYKSVGIETKTPDANLHVVGNVYVSSNLTVDTNTLHVDAETSRVGLGTKAPAYLLDVHGTSNVGALTAVSGSVANDFTVDTNTLYVDSTENRVGIKTLTPSTELHVEGNAYVSSNIQALTYFGDGGLLSNVTLQVISDHGNTTSNTIQFTNPTTALTTDLTSNVEVKLDQMANVNITNLLTDQTLVYDGADWINEYPVHTYIKIRNDLNGVNIEAGDAVYVKGTHNANVLNVGLALSDSADTMPCIGLSNQLLTPGQEGTAVAYGKALSVVTGTFVAGETVYVSNTVPGGLSNVKPFNNDLIQNVGVVTKIHASNGGVFVTGIGRANDIPNAQIVLDEDAINYVYVNNVNNDLKKIEPSNLLTQLQTFEQVSAAGNVVSNTMEFNNATTSLVTVANVEVGSNISVAGLIDSTNKHVPMVGLDGYLEKSPIYFTPGGTYVVSAAEAEFLGNLTLSGNTTILNSESVTISDRIFGVASNNSATGLDSGFMIEHQEGNPLEYANVALIYHADEHRFSISYTQNTFTDDHILHYEDETHLMLIDLYGNAQVRHNLDVLETLDVTGTTTLASDLTVGAASNLFVDVSTSRVGINEASPSASLDVNGDVNMQNDLTVAGNVNVTGDVTASNAILSGDFTVDTDTLIVNSTTNRVNIKALDVVSDVVITDDLTVDTDTLHVDSVSERVGLGTLIPDATLHVVGNTYVSSDLSVDGTTFHVDAGNHSVGVGTVTPDANLHVEGNAYISGEFTVNTTIDVRDATEAVSTTTGAVTIAGGLGVIGNVHAAQYHGDGSQLTGLVTTLEDVANNGNTMSNTIQFTNTFTSFVTLGNVGIANTVPGHDLSIGSNLYMEDTGSNVIHATGNIYATRFVGDGSFLENIASSLQQITDNGNETTNTVEFQNTGTSLITFGNVGVSNTSPGHDLSIGSNVYVEDVGSNVIHATGNIYATRFIGDGSYLENIASSLQQITDNGNTTSNTVQFTSDDTGLVTTGKIGVSVANPDANLHVVGNAYVSDVVTLASGLITNRDQVSKKTYAYSGTITSGTQPYINVNFTSDIFYSKISAQLVDGNEELSTCILEVSGGSKNGATPTKNISFGTKNVFGDPDNSNPWNEDVITTGNRIALRPLGTLVNTGAYHVFIEYTSPSADGGVTTIDEDTTSVVTFGY